MIQHPPLLLSWLWPQKKYCHTLKNKIGTLYGIVNVEGCNLNEEEDDNRRTPRSPAGAREASGIEGDCAIASGG
jgi:hypothetical protein